MDKFYLHIPADIVKLILHLLYINMDNGERN